MLFVWSSMVDDPQNTNAVVRDDLADRGSRSRRTTGNPERQSTMSHKELETGIAINDLQAQAMVGAELTDDELALVAGAMRPVYIGKTFFDDGSVESDWIVVNN